MTATTTPNLVLTVFTRDRASMDRQLEEAVDTARTTAMAQGRQGIVVTRHSHDSFTVALSDAVPFGLTYERQEW